MLVMADQSVQAAQCVSPPVTGGQVAYRSVQGWLPAGHWRGCEGVIHHQELLRVSMDSDVGDTAEDHMSSVLVGVQFQLPGDRVPVRRACPRCHGYVRSGRRQAGWLSRN